MQGSTAAPLPPTALPKFTASGNSTDARNGQHWGL